MMKKLFFLSIAFTLALGSLRAQVISVDGSSSGGNYTITNYPGNFTGAYDGFTVIFRSNHNTPGASTMNIGGYGSKPIVNTAGSALSMDDIRAGQVVMIIYDASNVRYQMVTTPGNMGGGGSITGGGTASYLTRWLTVATLDNSRIYDNGTYVGIGTSSPLTDLHVAAGVNGGIVSQNSSPTMGVQGGISVLRSRGSVAVPTALLSGDGFGSFAFVGYDGTGFTIPCAEIAAQTAEAFSPTNQGTNLIFRTTAIGNNSPLERMIISANGKVGIGTSSPNTNLEVVGNAGLRITRASNMDQILTLTGGDGSGNASVTAAYNLMLNTDLGGNIIFQSAGLTKAIMLANGNVGIGINTPGQKLTVDGSFGILETGASPSFHSVFQGGDQTDDIAYFLPPGQATAANQVLTNDGTGNLSWAAGGGGITGGGTASYIPRFATGSSLGNSLLFDDGSHVGIGITGPTTKLHVSGGTGIYNSNLLRLEGDYTSTGNYQQFDFARTADGNAVAGIRSIFDAAGQWSLDFYGTTGGTPFSTHVLRMQGNGRVGIGTANPNTSLDIRTTDAVVIPSGTVAERPATVTVGGLRFNSDMGCLEYFDGTGWNSLVPPGTIIAYGGAAAPPGWLMCQGAVVSRATYAKLFLAIGTNWGNGDGVSTFHLPDLRGRFLRGWNNASGRDPDAGARAASNPGGNTNDAVGSQQLDAMQLHNHSMNLSVGGGTASAGTNFATSPSGGVGPTMPSIMNAGGSTETHPKNVYVNYLIKY